MIVNLLISLMGILILTAVLFKRDFLAPSFLLTATFVMSAICANLYDNIWKFKDIRLNAIVIEGICGFIISAFITFKIDEIFHKNKYRSNYIEYRPIVIPQYKLVAYLIYQLILIFFMIQIINNAVHAENILVAIGSYYNMVKYNIIEQPNVISLLEWLNAGATLIIIYYMVYNLVYGKKVKRLVYINILLSLFESLLSGTRHTAMVYILSIIIMYMSLYNIKKSFRPNINVKFMIKMLVVLFCLLELFMLFATLQNRRVEGVPVLDTLVTYIGAPLKNLEMFIAENKKSTYFWGSATLNQTYNKLYSITHNEIFKTPSNLYSYRWIGNFGMGNVYTTFMPFYYDFGINGVGLVMAFIGFISQKFYDDMRFHTGGQGVNYKVILFSYSACAVLLLYFSNKFFEMIISFGFLYLLVGIIIFDIFFFKLDLKNRKIKIKF